MIVERFYKSVIRFLTITLSSRQVSYQTVAANGWRLGEGGDFYHQTSYEEPHFNYTKKCHTKH